MSVLKDHSLIQHFKNLPQNVISSLARFYVHDFVHLLDNKGQIEEEGYHEVRQLCHG